MKITILRAVVGWDDSTGVTTEQVERWLASLGVNIVVTGASRIESQASSVHNAIVDEIDASVRKELPTRDNLQVAVAPVTYAAGDHVRAARDIFYQPSREAPSGFVQWGEKTPFSLNVLAGTLGEIVAVGGFAASIRWTWDGGQTPPIDTMLSYIEKGT